MRPDLFFGTPQKKGRPLSRENRGNGAPILLVCFSYQVRELS